MDKKNENKNVGLERSNRWDIHSPLNCWSLRCSWSIACRRCSNYIFILHLTHGFNILRKNNYKPSRDRNKYVIIT